MFLMPPINSFQKPFSERIARMQEKYGLRSLEGSTKFHDLNSDSDDGYVGVVPNAEPTVEPPQTPSSSPIRLLLYISALTLQAMLSVVNIGL